MRQGQTLLFLYVALMFATGAVAMAAVAGLLSVRAGQTRSLPIMRALALLPGLLAVQTALLTYGRGHRWPGGQRHPFEVTVAAAVVPALGIVRVHVVGLMQLHTLPSRETLSLAQSGQIFTGSACIALGGLVGYAIDGTCAQACAAETLFSRAAACAPSPCTWQFLLPVSLLEAVRLALGALFLWLHRRENIAVP